MSILSVAGNAVDVSGVTGVRRATRGSGNCMIGAFLEEEIGVCGTGIHNGDPALALLRLRFCGGIGRDAGRHNTRHRDVGAGALDGLSVGLMCFGALRDMGVFSFFDMAEAPSPPSAPHASGELGDVGRGG